jgi:hypothetical protein
MEIGRLGTRVGSEAGQEAEPRYDAGLQHVRRIVGELDCSCRGKLDAALDRFAELQAAQLRRTTLRDARRARAAIATVLELLAELDEVTGAEADRSAYGELADLFDSVAAEAARGALLMRRLEAL